ncbi:Hypothetical protein DEACI_1060 [Acididesulfobacillus acetoxydans]|uniref:Uncharacterized protein n=1 Tax=Acididesulfobacillus acetoxydans TaxID=1561005 RepID=A0A8S0XVK2_9FIRM|nr:Hypothetical protein DEACI_1060 [Acididesulfobacillus acetoxydans]CEJ06541.1 Hypothetical protein DEACI_0989 [Acididesulfobacillus acetoxydans]
MEFLGLLNSAISVVEKDATQVCLLNYGCLSDSIREGTPYVWRL